MSGFAINESGNGGVSSADTELTDPASLSDNKSNGSAVEIDAKLSGFNGTAWDRIRSGLVGPTSTLTGILNTIGFGQYNSLAPTFTNGQVGSLQLDSNGNLKITVSTLPLPSDAATESTLLSVNTNLTPSSSGPTNGIKSVPTGSAEAISGSISATRGVLVIADSSNTTTIYVGGSGVTTSNGIDLAAGDARFYEVNNGNLIYCISGSASQILRYEIL